jgi:hypothetical protein
VKNDVKNDVKNGVKNGVKQREEGREVRPLDGIATTSVLGSRVRP